MKTEVLQGIIERLYVQSVIVSALLPVPLRPVFFAQVFYSAN